MPVTYPCATCGQECPPHAGRGRPRKWCSDACKPKQGPRSKSPGRWMNCSECGREMHRSRSSLPDGQATCLPCRRKRTTYAKHQAKSRLMADLECPICRVVFTQDRHNQVYCSAECRNARRPNWAPHVASAQERGYGKEHRAERARWKPIVEAGQAYCCLCGYWIEPGSKWHLDHTPERDGYRGVAHSRCNIRDGARRGARRGNASRPKIEKACPTCGSWFATPYPKQTYCSTKCRPKAKARPRTPAPPRRCLDCGVMVKRRKRCERCATEHSRTTARNTYRDRVGIPADAPLYSRAS